MKILMLNASPRKKGCISQMLEIIKNEAEHQGAEVEYIDVDRLNVRPCIACMKCRSSLNCVLPADDAHYVLQLLKESDALVVGAPCYWGNIPGILKVLFDRMVYGMMGENKWAVPVPLHKGKKCVIVSTSSTMWPFNIIFHQTRGVVRALKEILGWSGFKIVKAIEKGGTFKKAELTAGDRKNCLKAVSKLGVQR